MQWYHIGWAIAMAYMVWRMIPMTKEWLKNGPKGSSKDWMTTAVLLGGVVLFVIFLMQLVRS